MVVDTRPLRTDLSNIDWMNAIRNQAGSEYQNRIPEATQANIQDVVQNLWNWVPGRNQFVDSLVNKIGLTLFANTSWNNPLAVFKRGFLRYGETIEEIMTGLYKAVSQDPDRDELEREIFGKVAPEVQVNYHVKNRRDRYKFSIDEVSLRNAFTSPNGLQTMMGNLMSSVQTSDQNDEYLIMANLFKEFDKAAGDQGIFNVRVADVGLDGSDAAQSRYLLRQLRKFRNVLPFISRYYNPAGMPIAVDPSKLVLFTTADAAAAMDVEALAAAFNLDKAEFSNRQIVLPDGDYGIPGFQAALTTEDFFVCADSLITTTSIQNPANLFNNYWLHHHGVYSVSRFAPFVMFNSQRESTTISRTATPVTGISAFTIYDGNGATQATNLLRGNLYNVSVSAVTNPANGVNDAVRYEVVGAQSTYTHITQTGVLYVAPNETANTLTINAYAVDTDLPQIKASTTRNITGPLVRPWPLPNTLTDADSDTIEEPVLTPTTLKKNTSNNVIIPRATEGYNLTRTIKAGVAFTDATDAVTVAKHNAVAGDTVVFAGIATTTGITNGTTYYVKDVINEDNFTIAATAGGAVINLVNNGTATSATFVAKDGATYKIAAATDFTAVAEAGYEFAAGATTVWSFTP